MHASARIRCNRDQRKEPDVHGERAEFWEERRISWINISRESEISKRERPINGLKRGVTGEGDTSEGIERYAGTEGEMSGERGRHIGR